MASFTFNTTRHTISGKRERKTVSTAVIQITDTVYTVSNTDRREQRLASAAIVQCLTNGIRFTIDGTNPDATNGFEVAAGDFIYLDSTLKIKNFKAVRSGAADGAIEVVTLWGA